MTTLVVVRKGSTAAIAADSLTTFGDTRLSDSFDASSDKMVRYGETVIALCGSAAHQLVYENLLSTAKDLNFNSKSEIFETFRKLHAILKEQHYLNPKEEDEDAYESTHITALIANPCGIYGIYSMREVFEFKRFWAAGSGREYALGAMNALYESIDGAEGIARAGVEAGATFDKNSALPMQVITIAMAPGAA
jgi:ATP-dependent protease HslVU (ClpYQ) peptidase subunit